MALIELIDGHKTVIEYKKSDAYANMRKQAAWNDVTTKIKALFLERPITSTKELKELWRRMKNKAKSAAREKKADSHKTGGGEAVAGDLGGEILAVLAGKWILWYSVSLHKLCISEHFKWICPIGKHSSL